MRMYRQTAVVVKNGVVVGDKEFLRTTEETIRILENMNRIINNPTEKDKVVEYHRFGVLDCMAVRETIDYDGEIKTIIMAFKKFCD